MLFELFKKTIMENIYKKNLIVSIIPIFTFFTCCSFALLFQNSYHIDPDFVYLINGLNFHHGNANDIIHVDHPGTPLQILIGWLIPIISFLRNAPDVSTDVFLNPNIYIKTSIIFIAFLEAIFLFLIGKTFYKNNHNLMQTFILQSAILISSTVILFYLKIFTETLLPLGVLMIIFTILKKNQNEISDLAYSIIAGLIVGIFIATKITFAPILILAIFMIEKYKNIALFLGFSILSFFIAVLPVIERISYFQKFLFNVATHEGAYGTGNVEIFNPERYFSNMIDLLTTEWAFTIILSVGIVTLITNIIKHKLFFFKCKERKLMFAVILTIIAQLIVVSKNGGMRYMAPSLLLLSLLTILTIRHFPVKKNFSILFTLAIVFSIFKSHSSVIFNHSTELKHQHLMYDFINKNITKDDAVLIVTDYSWIGSPFIEHSLMFGKLYCDRQGYKYNETLNKLYPNRYFWTHHSEQYSSWDKNQMPELLLSKNMHNFYIYLQCANIDLQKRVLHDFENSLKIDNSQIITTKIYDDPFIKEEIFHIRLKNKIELKPKFQLSSSFENVAKDNPHKICTSNDSIFILDGNFRTDFISFNSKYSLSISGEREFGLSIPLGNIELKDFLNIELFCKRHDSSSEIMMVVKNAHPEDGFYAIVSSSSTKKDNGWEKLSFSYRIVNQPKDGLLEIYFWNNSKKDIFIDDFSLKLF